MKISPRSHSQGTVHSRTTQSSKSHKEQKSQNIIFNLKSKKRNDYSERYSNSKTTILLPEKKLNRSNINNFNETTLTSQLLLESIIRDSESRSRGKISDKGTNSKENTIIAGQSILIIPNSISQVPIEVQLQELRFLYEIKEVEAKQLQDDNNLIQVRLDQANDFIQKNKQLHSSIQRKETVIDRLKSNLGQAIKELDELKLKQKESLLTSRSSISRDGNHSTRENKKILIRMNTSTSKSRENKSSELKFKMYMEGLSQNKSTSSMKIRVPMMNLSNKHSKIHISGNQSARGLISRQGDNDNYLLSQHFGNTARTQVMTDRVEYTEYNTMGHIRRESPMQFQIKKWPINTSGTGLKHFSTEYNDVSIEENSLLDVKKVQKVRIIRNSHISPRESLDFDSQPIRSTSIKDGLDALISKFGKLLDSYQKSELHMIKKNQKCEIKLQAYLKNKMQKE